MAVITIKIIDNNLEEGSCTYEFYREADANEDGLLTGATAIGQFLDHAMRTEDFGRAVFAHADEVLEGRREKAIFRIINAPNQLDSLAA